MVNQPKETCAGQETKTRSKHQLKRESDRLSKCQMWITYPPTHILLKVSLSCTYLKTTMLSSRWLSKDEVQQWDTSPEPTELRLIGCSTELIGNQRSKSNMLTPKKTTCWHSNQRELFAWLVESSSPFVQHNEFIDVLLQPFQQFFLIRSESRAPYQREVKKRLPVKVDRWRSQNQWFQRRRYQSTWFYAARGARWKILRRTWDIQSIRGTTVKDKVIILVQGPPKTQDVQRSQVRRQENAQKFRFFDTVWSGGSFKLYWYKETCMGSNSKNTVSKYEEHEPSIHD